MIIENKVYSNQSYCAFRTCDAKIDLKRLAFQQHVWVFKRNCSCNEGSTLSFVYVLYLEG